MRIAIIGTGYVGLTTGAGFADFGHDVVCADIDKGKIAALCEGKIPFHEPGLPELVAENVRAGRLSFTTDVIGAARGAAVAFIAVGTPPSPEGHADLRHVLSAAEMIGRADPPPGVVVTKSTVPVGTTERVRDALRYASGLHIAVASNPEFLKEGTAVLDFQRPDRVVVGVEDEATGELLRRLYGPFVRDPSQILVMDVRSAELTKYASNAMLATRISFMNEMATLCEALGADIHHVRHGVGADARIGDQFLYAGIGFGGSCFGKDLQALCAMARGAGVVMEVADAVRRRNELQRDWFFDKIRRHFGSATAGIREKLEAARSIAQEIGAEHPLIENAIAHASMALRQEDPTLTRSWMDKAAAVAAKAGHGSGPLGQVLAEAAECILPLAGKTIAIWGLAFKPETDDVREAPALALVERLLQAGAAVRMTDPVALHNAGWYFAEKIECDESLRCLARPVPGRKDRPPLAVVPVDSYPDPYEAARGADALVLCTEWRQYRQPDFSRLRKEMAGAVLFDGRNIWDPGQVREAGFAYYGIGRP